MQFNPLPSDADVRFWVRLGLLLIVAIIAIFDLMLLQRYGPKGTISYILAEASRDFPLLPYLMAFGMGALIYHILSLARS